MRRFLPLLLLAPALSGCISTAASIITAPIRATGQVIDWTTTSQEESDRNYGRKMRKKEAREGAELRRQQRERREAEAKAARTRRRAEARARDDR